VIEGRTFLFCVCTTRSKFSFDVAVIYTPSQDQLNGVGVPLQDPPPAYEMVMFPTHHTMDRGYMFGSVEINDGETGRFVHPVIMSPPKYSIAAAPIPKYGDPV